MAQNVFGVVVSGRMLQTDFVQAGEREFMIEIPDADSINHVVIFLTGVQPFPDGTAGAVYMRWPLPSGNESNWHFLGYISNEKPSSIFKVAKLHRADAQHAGIFGSGFSASAHGTAQLGIQLDALSEIQSRVPDGVTEPTTQSTLAEFSNKMLQNLVNHAQVYNFFFLVNRILVWSFTVRLSRPDGLGTNEYIPLNALQDWFNTFSRRFQQNPYFWKGLNNG